MNRFAFLCLIFLMSSTLGCAIPEGDYHSTQTWGGMVSVGKGFSSFSFEECQRMETLREFLDLSVERKRMSQHTRKGAEKDSWGNAYFFERKVFEDQIVIRLVSKGPNAVFEDGGGDDITCEVTVVKTGERREKMIPRSIADFPSRFR